MADKIILSIRDVSKLLGVSERAIWGWANDGTFPPPMELGRLRRWRRSDIDDFLAQRAEAASQADKGVQHG